MCDNVCVCVCVVLDGGADHDDAGSVFYCGRTVVVAEIFECAIILLHGIIKWFVFLSYSFLRY